MDSTKQDLITAVEQGSAEADSDENEKSDETDKLEKQSKKIEKDEKKDDVAESASALAEEDLNVPKWPKYNDPTT